ncbi:MAG: glycosyltransferase [Bacteroidales bacterium]|nr:glycosyltransferase [Bacteroidales bacterium]
MTKVLYISYDGMTDPLGESQVIPYLKELSKKKVEISILSAEKESAYKLRKDYIQNLLRQYNIDWYPISYTKKPPVVSTVLDIIKLIKTSKKLHKQKHFDIVHCRSYISAFAGLRLKNKFGVKFLFDMRGFYADERVDGNLWPQSNPVFKMVYRFFKKSEKKFFSHADHTISLTFSGKDVIHNNFGFKNIDIDVIPCCADTDLFDFRRINSDDIVKQKSELNISSTEFILSYLGSVGTWYMPDEMMKFFKVLCNYKPHSRFLIITRDEPQIIYNIANKHEVDISKIIVMPANREDVPLLLSISNASIFFIKPVFSKKASSPTKLAELLGMGIPVICNANVGDLDKFIPENNLGVLIDNFDAENLDKMCKNLDNEIDISKEHLRSVALELFSLEKGVQTYNKVYQKMMNT